MARSLTLLRYQIISYWRRAFSLRGTYDSGSIFLIIITIAFFYAFFSILRTVARGLSENNTKNLPLLLCMIFFVWLLPASESLSLLTQRNKILYLPVKKSRFLANHLLTVFLMPTSVLAAVIALAALYPLAFAAAPFAAVGAAFFLFLIISILINFSFVNLLKTRVFRIGVVSFGLIFGAVLFASGAARETIQRLLPFEVVARIVNKEGGFEDLGLMIFYSLSALLLAVFSAAGAMNGSAGGNSGGAANKKTGVSFLERFDLPVKFGALLKKDLIYSWKMPDCYLSLLVTLLCAAAVIAFEDISFQLFNGFIVFSVMMSASLAFNIFGLETPEGIERYEIFPLSPREIIKTKNQAFAALVLTQTFFLPPVVFWRFGFGLFIVSMIKIASLVLLYAAWGNVLSIRHPFKMYFYQFAFGGSIPAILTGVLMISLVAVFSEVLTAGNAAAKLAVNFLTLAACAGLYLLSLAWAARNLPARWEVIRRAVA